MCRPYGNVFESDTWFVEPLEQWRWWSKRAYAMTAAALSRAVGDLSDDEWRTAHWDARQENWRQMSWLERRRLLAFDVNAWARAAGVGQGLEVLQDGTPRWVVEPRGLFGGLALLIGQALTGAQHWDVCSVCGSLHERDKRSRLGESIYCSEDCAKKGAARRAKRSRVNRPKDHA